MGQVRALKFSKEERRQVAEFLSITEQETGALLGPMRASHGSLKFVSGASAANKKNGSSNVCYRTADGLQYYGKILASINLIITSCISLLYLC